MGEHAKTKGQMTSESEDNRIVLSESLSPPDRSKSKRTVCWGFRLNHTEGTYRAIVYRDNARVQVMFFFFFLTCIL